jgi:hypothetical protein
MTDDRELAGLDPFTLLDTEAGRLDAFLSGLGEADWQRAARCAGWTVRDVLGHLAASEDYHRACLDGTVAALLADVADYADLSPAKVLARWRAASADPRRRHRRAGHARRASGADSVAGPLLPVRTCGSETPAENVVWAWPPCPRKRIWQMPGAIAAGVSSCGQAPLSMWAIPQPALILPAQGQT